MKYFDQWCPMPLSDFDSCTLDDLNNIPTQDILILTASNRLTFDVRRQLISHLKKTDSERKVFELPSAFSFKRWIRNFVPDLQFQFPNMPVVLNDIAENYYWNMALDKPSKKNPDEHIPTNNKNLNDTESFIKNWYESSNFGENRKIESDEDRFVLPMLSQTKAARLAANAHKLLCDWSIKVDGFERTPEYELFSKWREKYLKNLKKNEFWDSVKLNEKVLENIQNGILKVPKLIVLHGFYKITPYMQSILKVCEQKGSTVRVLYTQRPRASEVSLFKAKDIETEIKYAVDWASKLLDADPNKKVAIVVPELQSNLLLLQRELKGLKNWHISLGRPLIEWSLIKSIIYWFELILNLHKPKIPLLLVGNALLKAEFGFTEKEREKLAHIDFELRKRTGRYISNKDLSEIFYKNFHLKTEILLRENDDWINAGNKDISHWADAFRITLTEFEFPSDAPINSHNYQLCNALETVLNSLSAMHHMLPEIDAHEAVSLLKQSLTETVFQFQRDANSKLDVIGPYEVEGGRWDHVWVCGLQSKSLPQSPSHNPLIPLYAQIRAGVDLTTWDSTWELSEQIFNGILHTSSDIVLSYSEQNDKQKLFPSPLLQPYLENEKELAPIEIQAREKAMMQLLDDRLGLPFDDDIKRGGSNMVELQSLNPLWYYAKYRLHVEDLKPYPKDDYDSLVRGNYLHKILELFYKEHRSSNSLAQIENLEEDIDKFIRRASNEILAHFDSSVMRESIEQSAKKVILYFLKSELMCRVPFEIVHLEKNEQYSKGYMDVNFKVDRVDKVGDKFLIIDYKTSNPTTASNLKKYWIDRERMKKSQLPFYASLIEDEISNNVIGVLNVFLHQGRISNKKISKTYAGVLGDETLFENSSDVVDMQPLNSEDWINTLQTWRTKIDSLLEEIEEGHAPNSYLDLKDMEYCEIKPFLRLFDQNENEVQNDE